jgi:predicted RNase H-like nuclease (RuvC/YqgF family)
MGLSQRPADVKKDFITQADLLVWHRLTWENDTDVVKRVVGSDYADRVDDLGDGEAFVQADWSDGAVEQVQVRRKETYDFGATPGLDDADAPELKSIGEDLVDELEEISDQHERRQDRIAELEDKLEEKEERIAELEEELEDARDLQRLGEAFVDAAQGGDADVENEQTELLEEKNETIAKLRERVDDLKSENEQLQEEIADLRDERDRLESYRDRVEQAEQIEEQLERAREVLGVDVGADHGDNRVNELQQRVQELEAENERLREQSGGADLEPLADYQEFLETDAVQEELDVAKKEASCSPRYVKGVIAAIIDEGGWVSYEEIAERLGVSTTSDVSTAASELERRRIVQKEQRDGGMHVDLNVDGLNEVRQTAARREQTQELMEGL